jgi:hypothetical protein
MKFITPTNDPFARIGFATTYKELPDEYNYAAAPKYEAEFSNFLCGKRCRERKAAELEATKAKTAIDQQLAAALQSPAQPKGLSTGGKIGLALGVLGLVGVTIWALKK